MKAAGLAMLLGCASAVTASAHVNLLGPLGGEKFDIGSSVTVEWQVHVSHDTQDWDLFYSTNGAGGPWKELAMDLPAGDISEGAVHTFQWTIPEEVSDDVRVRVRQDNSDEDYEDESDSANSIRQLVLRADPEVTSPSNPLTISGHAATLPGAQSALYILSVNGTPSPVPVLFPTMDGSGKWELVVPSPNLQGLELELIAFSRTPAGQVSLSNLVTIR